MKTIPRSILILCTLMGAIACTESLTSGDGFTITGQVTGFPDGTKFYLRNLATESVMDSATLQGNNFRFEGHLAQPPEQIWLIANPDSQFVYTNLLMGNDDITVRGDVTDFPWNVEIEGSKSQEDYNFLRNLTKVHDIQRDSLVKNFLALPPEEQQQKGKQIWTRIGKIDSTTRALRMDYVRSHPDTYISVIELGYLKNGLPKDTIREIFDRYTPEIKASKYASVVEVFLRENISSVGDQYHDFEAFNQEDQIVKLSDIRGAYTLLDFTAAYCGPCIQAADELAMIHQGYSDSLEVVSVSQDAKKEVWLKSLERDNVAWNSLWDGKGRYSETSIKYGIQGIPAFVLIDPKGTIIDMWTGYSENSIISRLDKSLQLN